MIVLATLASKYFQCVLYDQIINFENQLPKESYVQPDVQLTLKPDMLPIVQSTAHQTIHWTLCRSYFKGISANIELQVYSETRC
jgi:hypothetical protein